MVADITRLTNSQAFSILGKFEYLEEITLPGLKRITGLWWPAVEVTISAARRPEYMRMRSNAFIKVAAMIYESCFALRLIRFMPDRQHLSEGFDEDYCNHDSPYLYSVEAGRDSNGDFSSFRWRPQIGPLDASLVASRNDFHHVDRSLGNTLYPVIKKVALSGNIDVLLDDQE